MGGKKVEFQLVWPSELICCWKSNMAAEILAYIKIGLAITYKLDEVKRQIWYLSNGFWSSEHQWNI